MFKIKKNIFLLPQKKNDFERFLFLKQKLITHLSEDHQWFKSLSFNLPRKYRLSMSNLL